MMKYVINKKVFVFIRGDICICLETYEQLFITKIINNVWYKNGDDKVNRFVIAASHRFEQLPCNKISARKPLRLRNRRSAARRWRSRASRYRERVEVARRSPACARYTQPPRHTARRARICAHPCTNYLTKLPTLQWYCELNFCASVCVRLFSSDFQWVLTEIVRIFLGIWHTYDVNNGAGIRRPIDSLKSNKC